MLVSVDRRKVAKISFVIAAMLAAVCTEGAFAGVPTDPGNQNIANRVAALEALVAQQAGLIKTLQSALTETKSVTDAVKPLTPYLTFDDQHNIYLTGANLNIRSGSGKTDGDINGLGNLIVGYNESYSLNTRTGSHNLVVGPLHSYSSYGGLVAGYRNTISGRYSSVSGGTNGTASGDVSSVSGGVNGTASGGASSVSGGGYGTASGVVSSVSGGAGGTASGGFSSVSGGQYQKAETDYSYAP